VEMDDPNITMDEYIELQVEKAHRHFPAIIHEGALASDHEISSKPMENDNDKINISSEDIIIEPSDNAIDDNIDANSYEFDNNFETNHDIHHMAPLPSRDQRHLWLKYEG
ncbi:hypothetical protein Tco_1478876, partial [Tanacetum coccineum]